jgi:hypothetical protein
MKDEVGSIQSQICFEFKKLVDSIFSHSGVMTGKSGRFRRGIYHPTATLHGCSATSA